MTKEEKLIASCFTGVLFCDLRDFREYAEKLLGRPVWTHELTSEEVWRALKEKTEDAFVLMCKNNTVPVEHVEEMATEEAEKVKKCSWPNGVKVKTHGYEVDPCIYQEIERHEGVTVTVSKCKKCGAIDISWEYPDKTDE